jgi:biotin operon repressor
MSSKPPNLSKLESLAVYATEGAIPEYLTLREIQQEKADDFVRGVLNTIIEKDILQRLDIRDKHNFNKIIDFVLDSVGSFVSPRSISDTLRTNGFVVDKEAVAKYLDAMCEAFLLHKVPRYEIKGKGLLQTLNKYYLVDPCFRRVRLRRDMKKDIPHWLENVVYFELLRRNRDVYIGKFRDKEIDFVVTDRNGYTSYYQVAWTTMNRPETLERELAPLRSINDSNPKFLLTTDIDVNPVYDGIQKLNVMDWLLSAPDALATAEIPQPTPPAKQTPEQTAGEGLGIKTDGGLGKRLGMKLGIKLGINHEKIIDLIKENPCVTMSEIAEKLKVSDTSIEKSIQRLKALGILTRVGARKNGHWQLAEQTNHS